VIFDYNDQARVREMEEAIEQAIERFASTTEAGLGAIACARVAKRLLAKYRRKDTRSQLAQVIVDYLEDREAPRFAKLMRGIFN
jgi:hypothetical protein